MVVDCTDNHIYAIQKDQQLGLWHPGNHSNTHERASHVKHDASLTSFNGRDHQPLFVSWRIWDDHGWPTTCFKKLQTIGTLCMTLRVSPWSMRTDVNSSCFRGFPSWFFVFGLWCVDDGPFFNQKLDGRSRVEEAAVHHWTEPAVATASMFVNSWSSWCLESVDGDGQWESLRWWRCTAACPCLFVLESCRRA
jgi:hypothetical protein